MSCSDISHQRFSNLRYCHCPTLCDWWRRVHGLSLLLSIYTNRIYARSKKFHRTPYRCYLVNLLSERTSLALIWDDMKDERWIWLTNDDYEWSESDFHINSLHFPNSFSLTLIPWFETVLVNQPPTLKVTSDIISTLKNSEKERERDRQKEGGERVKKDLGGKTLSLHPD